MIGITIGVVVLLLGGGDKVEHHLVSMQDSVKAVITDKDRRKAVMQESKVLAKDLVEVQKQVQQHLDHLVDVHKNFGSTKADFMVVAEALQADQMEAAMLLMETRDRIKAQMSREEWEAVFRVEQEME
ncbi:hypothetical protein [Coraliomargarita akajimensis]|uniref:Uncharacterized protein n=1 Tax=Coraliomargarita akajimensis (strain DSM 45221 / IAM 15411 / JCM 23193 / KCTC 12865 / 04OKA010-24) TaxID=583355 RepID=D5EPW6_CORAD|nr:hypothetical protein [Coraliomargarita akajimensis]ADE55699.1 hypothetical protein Caka_2684 [Coraliomargarita akajimensis DSM 45221]